MQYYHPSALAGPQEDLLMNGNHQYAPRALPPSPHPSVPAHPSQIYPSYDPNSPFNSPLVPVKNVGKDGRLKTMLMGIGIDGGFLTSPLTFGRSPKPPPPPTNPEIQYQSHLQQQLPPSQQLHRSPGHPHQAQNNNNIILPDGYTALECAPSIPYYINQAGGGHASLAAIESRGEVGVGGSLPGARRQRTVSAAPPRSVYEQSVDVSECLLRRPVTPQSPSGQQYIDNQFSHDPPPPPLPSKKAATGKKLKKAVSTWSLKTLSKTKSKSCPSLTESARTARESSTAATYQRPIEPRTPVTSNYMPLPGVPFNSPVDFQASLVEEASTMPFSFADLYNFGLAADSIADIDPRKSPHDFANDLLGTENDRIVPLSASGGIEYGEAGDYLADLSDYGLNYGLPTPHLAPSGFSSPSTEFNSDTSPTDVPPLSPSFISHPVILDGSTLQPIPMRSGSRQRCVSYNQNPRSRVSADNPPLDSSFFESVKLEPQLSNTSSHLNYAPRPAYIYPSGYVASEQQQGQPHHLGPYSAPNDPYPSFQPGPTGYYVARGGSYPSQSGSFTAQGGLFETRGGLFGPQPAMPSYEAQLRGVVSLDHIYDLYSRQGSATSTPKKRGRETTDDESDAKTDGDEEYVPGGAPRPAVPTPKRQRVVSAPASVGRRLRPGPRPKSQSRSPQQNPTSPYSLSPPPVPALPGSISTPYLSDGSPYLDGGGPTEVHRSRHREEVVPLPKEVIQSMYNMVAATVVNGIKGAKYYECLLEGCGREFPRKSAIENHIQTHLEDKPFACTIDDCNASFVRQHDLRRHEKIHSGSKPFPCPCGKGFARGDALHRHRQRGICCGSLVPRRS